MRSIFDFFLAGLEDEEIYEPLTDEKLTDPNS